MLPEHVKLLKQYNKNLKKVEKPILDEQKFDEFNDVISGAIEEDINLEFTYYQKGEIKKCIGKINQFDYLNKKLHIINQELKSKKLNLDDILEIEYYLR